MSAEPVQGDSLPRSSRYSFDQILKDEMPSRTWTNLVVLNPNSQDW